MSKESREPAGQEPKESAFKRPFIVEGSSGPSTTQDRTWSERVDDRYTKSKFAKWVGRKATEIDEAIVGDEGAWPAFKNSKRSTKAMTGGVVGVLALGLTYGGVESITSDTPTQPAAADNAVSVQPNEHTDSPERIYKAKTRGFYGTELTSDLPDGEQVIATVDKSRKSNDTEVYVASYGSERRLEGDYETDLPDGGELDVPVKNSDTDEDEGTFRIFDQKDGRDGGPYTGEFDERGN